jgi:kynurenine 3-monooxygenase
MSQDAHPDRAPVAIVGGGLAGSLSALYLARRGYAVDVYEYRDDMRQGGASGGRSINLALSERGLNALRGVGLEGRVRELCIPMHGRRIHPLGGDETQLQPYGEQGQFINSVSRRLLNELLMDEAESHERVNFHFGKKCAGFTRATGALRLKDEATGEFEFVEPDVILGADGAYSQIRYRMQTTGGFEYSQSYLTHGYKELTIPPAASGGWRIDKNALHIWPREDFMMIALPNLDGSFTCTLFMPYEGEVSFDALHDAADVRAFFERWFPDAIPHLPRLEEEFFENPTGSLVTIRCAPYHFEDKALLIGDAAHAVVPFYGQGMNAAFEDCFELDRLVSRFDGDWSRVLPEFSRIRKPNADAIADLAMYNYLEMRDLVSSPTFLLKKKVDRALHLAMPQRWIPLYTMVSFTNIPYAEAKARAEHQDLLLKKAGQGLAAGAAFGLGALLLGRSRR